MNRMSLWKRSRWATLTLVAIAILFCWQPLGWAIDQTTSLSVAPDSVDLANGAAIFEANCASCHANGGNIIRRGKNLQMKALRRNHRDSIAAIAEIVSNGKMPMSAYRDRLTEAEIQEVSVYVLTQAEQGWQ